MGEDARALLADSTPAQQLDARGGWLLPGIIDLHGDAFERQITPRAGTEFPLELALAANDASLVANGITTFFYSITDGFEPGPRSRHTVRRLLAALEQLKPRFACQARVHIRHEKVNTDDHDELLAVRIRTLGGSIAEFPMYADVAQACRDAGIAVLMGAPNLVRGGSHVGAIGVREALEQKLVDILCSDYHYASLFHAPFLAAQLGLLPLEEAWKLVSENPARAAGLTERPHRAGL